MLFSTLLGEVHNKKTSWFEVELSDIQLKMSAFCLRLPSRALSKEEEGIRAICRSQRQKRAKV